MSKSNIIRAWKDPVYRDTLGAEERATLPPHPAGGIEIRDEDLRSVAGGAAPPTWRGCPDPYTVTCTCFNVCAGLFDERGL